MEPRLWLHTLMTNWRFRRLVQQRIFPYNSGLGRIPADAPAG